MKISTGNEAFMCKSKGTFPMLPMEHLVKPYIQRLHPNLNFCSKRLK